jgi:hypothetical protein
MRRRIVLALARVRPVRRTYLELKFARLFRRFEGLRGADARFRVRWADRAMYLDEATPETAFDRHYVYHCAWASRVVAETHPEKHVDIASSLYFATQLSAFVPAEFYDYRPAALELSNLATGRADLLALEFPDRSIASLSCMHVVEHVGLGRYGEPLDPQADLLAMSELQRVVAAGGSLLFVVPVGAPRIVFNAHRIYAYEQVVDAFPELTLREFALIPDDPAQGGLLRNADPALVKDQLYGCGCFWFTRA